MRASSRALLTLLLASAATGSALASWTASGSFVYVNREQDSSGFTGVETPRPIRFADVEVVDASLAGRRAILASGATDANGGFSVFVSDSQTRDVYVRVITSSLRTAGLYQDVRQNTGTKPIYYAAASPTVAGHPSGASHDFGTISASVGAGAEAFNLYDSILRGADYVASMDGARPGSSDHLAVVWGANNGVSDSYYDSATGRIILRDTAGYDDTVVLHEMGHHIIRRYSIASPVNAGSTFSNCSIDIRQAFEEGWASYFGNSSLRHAGIPGSNIYTRTNGSPGPGGLVRYADFETDTQYLCQGSAGEFVVASVLWDMADGASTADTTPGVEDGPHDTLELLDGGIWETLTVALPAAGTGSMETFWDGWFLPPVQNGSLGGMIAIAAHHGVDYFEDAREVNDLPAQAAAIPTDGAATHASFFRDPEQDGAGAVDEDWFSFNASSGQSYELETTDLKSDGNTALRLYDTNGTTLLALNDDRSASDESSLISWVAPRTDLFYVRVYHEADIGRYGSYDLSVAAQIPSDDDGDGYLSTVDCDDTDPNVHPGAAEVCDGVDQDCDGATDDGFDGDLDGFTTCGGDCDDGNPGANPGEDEIPGNGIDDNCNGETDEAPSIDTVTILSAVWKPGPKKITVEATSDQQPGVTLTVVGFGTMVWDPALLKYSYTSPKLPSKPATVTVESSGGGSDSAPVQ